MTHCSYSSSLFSFLISLECFRTFTWLLSNSDRNANFLPLWPSLPGTPSLSFFFSWQYSPEPLFFLLQPRLMSRECYIAIIPGDSLSVPPICRTLRLFWNKSFMPQLLCDIWRVSVSDGRKRSTVGVKCRSYSNVRGSAGLELSCPDPQLWTLQETSAPCSPSHATNVAADQVYLKSLTPWKNAGWQGFAPHPRLTSFITGRYSWALGFESYFLSLPINSHAILNWSYNLFKLQFPLL